MIKHDSPIPLYQQLSLFLEENIRNGEYKDGQRLPSESQLCKLYNVSRITVRQALSILEQKNLVYSVHGKGTFVHLPPINQKLLKITSFERSLQEKGLKGNTKINFFKKENISFPILHLFSAEDQDEIVSLSLTGYANNTPLVYYISYFPDEIGEKIFTLSKKLEKSNKAFSTFDLIKEIDTPLQEIEQKLTAVNGNTEICQILSLPDNSALLRMETFVYTENKKLIEYKIAYYRADKYSFTLKRQLD